MAKVAVLAGASDPRDRTGEAHDGEDLPAGPHSCIAARTRGVRNDLHLEAEARSCIQHPDDYGNSDRQEKAKWQNQAVNPPARPRGLVAQHLPLWEDAGLEAARVAQVGVAVEDQILE